MEEGSSKHIKFHNKIILNKVIINKLIILISLCLIGIIIMLLVKRSSYIAEFIFAKGIFKVVSQIISFITGLLPFSLAELIIVTSPIIVLSFLIICIVKIVHSNKKDRLKIFINGLLNFFIFLAAEMLLFIIGCGVNYYRYPVSSYLGLEVTGYTSEQLYNLCVDLAERTNQARAEVEFCEDSEGIYRLDTDLETLGKYTSKAYKKLAEKYEIFSGVYPSPKHVHFSRVLSSMEITGIFIPFTMEANVNVDIPDYSIASTMCHELAHLHGFIREDEANYIAYLVCINSENPALNYSGLMEALIVAGNALYSQNKDMYYRVRNIYSEGVLRDLSDNNAYWAKFENTVISNTANKVNDAYLKANNQTDGVRSYGRMVDLLLAEYIKNNE